MVVHGNALHAIHGIAIGTQRIGRQRIGARTRSNKQRENDKQPAGRSPRHRGVLAQRACESTTTAWAGLLADGSVVPTRLPSSLRFAWRRSKQASGLWVETRQSQ